MGDRAKRAARCPRCRMHEALCVCEALPRLALETRVVLVMHRREVSKTTATGPLALAALDNAELRVHGHQDRPLDLGDLNEPGRRSMVLFPHEDAVALDRALALADPRPVTLIVPDGSWRQASKMARRLPGLDHALPVTLPPGPPTRWGVRNEPHPQGLATFEAIARALGALESPEVQAQLEAAFELMARRTLQSRGVLRADDGDEGGGGDEGDEG